MDDIGVKEMIISGELDGDSELEIVIGFESAFINRDDAMILIEHVSSVFSIKAK